MPTDNIIVLLWHFVQPSVT